MRKMMMAQGASPDEKEEIERKNEGKREMIDRMDKGMQRIWRDMKETMWAKYNTMKQVNQMSKDYLELASSQYVNNFDAMKLSCAIFPVPSQFKGFLKVTLNKYVDLDDKGKQERVTLDNTLIDSPWWLNECVNASDADEALHILGALMKSMENNRKLGGDKRKGWLKTIKDIGFRAIHEACKHLMEKESTNSSVKMLRIYQVEPTGKLKCKKGESVAVNPYENDFLGQIEKKSLRKDSWVFSLKNGNGLIALVFSLSPHHACVEPNRPIETGAVNVASFAQKLIDEAIKVFSRRVIHLQMWESKKQGILAKKTYEIVARTQHFDVSGVHIPIRIEDSVTECMEIRKSETLNTDEPTKKENPMVFRQGVFVDTHTNGPTIDNTYSRITCLQMGVARLYMQGLPSPADHVQQGVAENITPENLKQIQNITVKSCIIKGLMFHAEDGSKLEATMMTSRVCVNSGAGKPISRLRIRTVYVLSTRPPAHWNEIDEWEPKTMEKRIKENYHGKTLQPHYNVWHPNLKPTPGSEKYMLAKVGDDEEEDHWTLRGQIVYPELPSRSGSKKGKTTSFSKRGDLIGLGVQRAMEEMKMQIQGTGSGVSPHAQIANVPKKGLSSSTASQPAVRALPKRVVLR